jgi:hypothetical protein
MRIGLRPIRAILIAMGSPTTRFREVVQKNFLCPSIDESDANPPLVSDAFARRTPHHADRVACVSNVREVRILQGFLASSENRRRIRARRESVSGA